MERSRILVVTQTLDVGGTENHLLQVLPRLDRNRFDVRLMVLRGGGKLEPEMEAAGIPVLGPLPGQSAFSRLLTTVRILMRETWRDRPVLHFFLPEPYLIAGVISRLLPVRASLMSRRSRNHYQSRHRLAALVERLLHRRMALVLANSEAVASDLRDEGVPTGRLRKVYNGIDPDRFAVDGPRDAARASLGVPPDGLVIVTVGNLRPYKGHADLLDALALLAPRLTPGWSLLCVGRDEAYEKTLTERARALGIANNVRFLGERRDVGQILAISDIGVLASHEEGFSNAVLEKMAAGLPVVATRVGGNAEAVEDGHCGFIVPPHDPPALAEALGKLAADQAVRQSMGQQARRRVAEHFSLRATVAAYEAIYDEVLSA